MVEDAGKILGRRCSPRCLAMVSPGVFRCRKLNNVKVSTDNKKHAFKPLPNDYSLECLELLEKIGLIEPIQVSEVGYEDPFKSCHEYYTRQTRLQKRYIRSVIILVFCTI